MRTRVMYSLWKLTAGGQSRCQVAAGSLKESRRGAGGQVSQPDLLYRITVLIKEEIGIKETVSCLIQNIYVVSKVCDIV